MKMRLIAVGLFTLVMALLIGMVARGPTPGAAVSEAPHVREATLSNSEKVPWPPPTGTGATGTVKILAHIYLASERGPSLVRPQQTPGPSAVAPERVSLAGPTTGTVATAHTFTATTNPITVTTPVTYRWPATGQVSVTHVGGTYDTASFTWDTPGLQVLTLTAMNLSGTATATHTVQINARVYMPTIYKNFLTCGGPPTLLSPPDASVQQTLLPTYRWDNGSATNATTTRLEVAKDPDFDERVNSLWFPAPSGELEFQFSRNLEADVTYYWRVWLVCGEVAGPISEVWSFTTNSGGTILPAPTLVAPPNQSTQPVDGVTLDWNPVGGAEGYIARWSVAGSPSTRYQWVTGTSLALTGLNAGSTYEWYVEAYNDYAIGTESTRWRFTTTSPAASGAHETPHHPLERRDGTTHIAAPDHK